MHSYPSWKMDPGVVTSEADVPYPILLIPKKRTNLEYNFDATEGVFIEVKILSPDTEGNDTCIYAGFCNFQLLDTYDVDIQYAKPSEPDLEIDLEPLPVILADQQAPDYQNEVWIDPARSPFVYNHYGMSESQQCYAVRDQPGINMQQQNTYNITEYKYNYQEAIHYSTHEDVVKKPKMQQYFKNFDDEFDCGVFLTQLSEEIINQKQKQAIEESKFIGLQSVDSALKQLMSPGIQSMSRQRKTILFLGPDSQCGQTIQQISYSDSNMKCSEEGSAVDTELINNGNTKSPKRKRYQCAKCHQIFDFIADFREHMVNHSNLKHRKCKKMGNSDNDLRYICGDCGKSLKSREKFEKHCKGHGNPDLECNRCFKVFASKFTLRSHQKTHSRKYSCAHCTKTFSKLEDMRRHAAKVHNLFFCDQCDYICNTQSQLFTHKEMHENFAFKEIHENKDEMQQINFIDKDLQEIYKNNNNSGSDENNYSNTDSDLHDDNYKIDSSETEFTDSLFDDFISDDTDPDWKIEDELEGKYANNKHHKSQTDYELQQDADSVIAKVMANDIFLAGKLKKNNKRCKKVCDVCQKSFDRVSDLKRHLIEHIVRSTLAKTPVTRAGTLTIHCEVCQQESFTKVDRYKAHLREHAKLTLYQCIFCNKSFSDSSNFSKHKKIHGATYFQCDLCQRKFNSKKMIIRHMNYHRDNQPVSCLYCSREFHFESMLNKHIKSAHNKKISCRFRCRFCQDYFTSLKNKWDHEWRVHNVRKMIVDCLICNAKFRKYAELKRHCIRKHDVEIPTAKSLLKSQFYNE